MEIMKREVVLCGKHMYAEEDGKLVLIGDNPFASDMPAMTREDVERDGIKYTKVCNKQFVDKLFDLYSQGLKQREIAAAFRCNLYHLHSLVNTIVRDKIFTKNNAGMVANVNTKVARCLCKRLGIKPTEPTLFALPGQRI